MSGIFTHLSISTVLVSSLVMYGCSSGSGDSAPGGTSTTYSGLTIPAAVNVTNAEALATSSGEAVQRGADSLSSNVFGIAMSSNTDEIEALSASLATAMASNDAINLPSAYTMNGNCGGNVTIPDSQLESFNAGSGPASFTMTFTEYCDSSVGAQYTINGQVVFNYIDIGNPNSGFTIQYIGVTANDGSGPVTINMTVDCSNLSTCTIVSDYVGADGSTYRVSEMSFYGDATTGINGSATFYHSSIGSVTITASSVTYGSCGVHPDGGTIDVIGTTGSAQAVFNSNCTYVINYDDGAGGVGVINGSFI